MRNIERLCFAIRRRTAHSRAAARRGDSAERRCVTSNRPRSFRATVAQRPGVAIVSLGCFRLLAVPLAICGLAFNNIQLLLLAVAVLVAVMGSALVISLRDARQRRARVIDGLGPQDHP